jgi:hypothetical protein
MPKISTQEWAKCHNSFTNSPNNMKILLVIYIYTKCLVFNTHYNPFLIGFFTFFDLLGYERPKKIYSRFFEFFVTKYYF